MGLETGPSMHEENQDLLQRYNYPDFTPEYFEPWMRFNDSPNAGETGGDFPLWCAHTGAKRSLAHIWSEHPFTVVEFGSFT